MDFIEKHAVPVIGGLMTAMGTVTWYLLKKVLLDVESDLKSLEDRVNARLDAHEETLDKLGAQHQEIRVEMATISTKIDSVKEMEERIITRLHTIQDSINRSA